MTKNCVKRASEHAPITNIALSDACGGEAIAITMRGRYARHEFGNHMRNIGIDLSAYSSIS